MRVAMEPRSVVAMFDRPYTRRLVPACALALVALSLAACASDAEDTPESANGDVDESAEIGTAAAALTINLPPGTIPLPPIILRGNLRRGTLRCLGQPLADVPVEIGGVRAVTNASGVFEIPGTVSTLTHTVRVVYDGTVTSNGVSTPMRVMDELKNGRSESRSATGTWASTTAGLTVDFGTIALTSLDCELYRLGRLALRDYHALRGAQPPDRAFEIKRMSDVHFGTPYAFYDHVVIRTNWLDGTTSDGREETIFHEFGHTLRHVADGPEHHWNWDNFRWVYARTHTGHEIFNVQYAFNEGWAGFWEHSRFPAPRPRASVPVTDARNVHFVENMVINRLLDDLSLPGSSRRLMMQVLEDNPGEIHSLHEFETRLFARLGRAAPPTPPSCPIGWRDDGATCSTGGRVVAKSSYGRGVGTVPTACGAGNSYDAGLCYPACRADHDDFGALCIQDCRPGYQDDGLFCRRDAHITSSDNSACPWWDVCGLTTNRGCSVCPAGYQNDGCTCRRDADIYAKSSYGRGAGWVPTACAGGKVYDAGLCYDPCRANWSGVGPVCYSPCSPGFDDDGATCREPLSVIVKY